MIDIERVVESLIDAEPENTRLTVSASPQALRRVHEEDFEDEDDETIKDILGPDFYDPRPPTKAVPGNIDRFGRWANVTIGNREYCISYLTPVAVYDIDGGLRFTEREWSATTSHHIARWAKEIGMTNVGGVAYKFYELKKRFKRIPQEELTQMFKVDSAKVDWTKKDMRAAERVPSNGRGYKWVDPQHKVSLPKWEEPKEEI